MMSDIKSITAINTIYYALHITFKGLSVCFIFENVGVCIDLSVLEIIFEVYEAKW